MLDTYRPHATSQINKGRVISDVTVTVIVVEIDIFR